MPTQDQLEIISATGSIQFYDLDPNRGIINIGRHPENDIILDSPGVAPFHAMLDYRQKPYQLVVLSQEGETRLAGQPLPPNMSSALQNWDSVEFDGYTIILVEGEGFVVSSGPAIAPPSPPPAPVRPSAPSATTAASTPPAPRTPATVPLPVSPGFFPPPTTRPEMLPSSPHGGGPAPGVMLPLPPPAAAAPQGPIGLANLPPDHLDDFIVTELTANEWTIDVERTASFQLTIINGGDIVATFNVGVEGLDESWVTISQPQINLNEGERATVTFVLTAPRLPSSRAGAHHFAIVVTSPNYPRRYSQRGATLIINPYYEFAVGELDPKRQTISWFQRAGQSRVAIHNRGNSDTFFRLEGINDERACSFEFQVPGEIVGLAQQAELRLPPEETISIPVRIAPYSRRLVGLRKRTYTYTITTTAIAAQQTPRSLLGQLAQKPLLGPFPLALLALLLLLLVVYIFLPTIYLFTGEPQMIRAGEQVSLRWRGATFTNLRIDNGVGPVPGTAGEVIVAPKNTTTYKLSGDNWLSAISPSWFGASKEVKIEVEPVKPIIRVFSTDKGNIISGEDVTLSWEVIDADDLTLQTNGSPETLLSTEHTSQRVTKPDADTTYTLVARNIYGDVTKSLSVKVVIPTATPVPTPFVKKFIANPSVIVVGTPVIIEWDVDGADVVSVQPIGGNLPPIQSVSQSPQQDTTYVLNAAKGSSAIKPVAVQVFVTPAPTATPEPEAPQIEYFQASQDTFVIGGQDEQDNGNRITLSWSVVGTVTDVQISNPDFGTVTDLQPKATLDVTINDKRNFFVLTAFNGDKKASKTVQLTLETPTPTTTPQPTSTPVPPPAQITDFKIISPGSPLVIDAGGDNPHRYQVQKNVKVTFQWQTNNAATKVIFSEPNGAAATGGVPVGQVPDKLAADGNYTLVAENSVGKQTNPKVIQIQLVDPPPPNPPFNVNGVQDQANNTNKLTWNWTFDAAKSDIIGFRVYRADLPGTNFTPISNPSLIAKGSSGAFDDKISAPDKTCNKGYYVVAVYQDLQGNERESAVSTNSWFSSPGPCP